MADSMPRVPRISPIGGLRFWKPEEWEKTIRSAMAKADGRVEEAAKALGVSTRQLFRWLKEPTFADMPRAPVGLHRAAPAPLPARRRRRVDRDR